MSRVLIAFPSFVTTVLTYRKLPHAVSLLGNFFRVGLLIIPSDNFLFSGFSWYQLHVYKLPYAQAASAHSVLTKVLAS